MCRQEPYETDDAVASALPDSKNPDTRKVYRHGTANFIESAVQAEAAAEEKTEFDLILKVHWQLLLSLSPALKDMNTTTYRPIYLAIHPIIYLFIPIRILSDLMYPKCV